jgi:4,5-dihydroxyphthalate decarboxylase
MNSDRLRLTAALGRTPLTAGIIDGTQDIPGVAFNCTSFPIISRAFAPMVRERKFDVSEMAIATFLQARAWGKPLVLLPIVLAARFQEQALLCRVNSPLRRPEDLVGRRIGVRAYSQTTGLWLRGILAEAHGVAAEAVRWVTFEDAHVAEVADPPWATRAPPGAELLAMLRDGEIDAAIVGSDMPDDPTLRCVFADAAAAGEAFWARHGVVPINHMLAVDRATIEANPDVVGALMGLFHAAKAGLPAPAGGRDFRPIGNSAVSCGVALAQRFASEQAMLPRPLSPDEVWDGLPVDFRPA